MNHTGQCKSTGGCYNELVVAIFSTGAGVKGKKSINSWFGWQIQHSWGVLPWQVCFFLV